MKKRNSLFLILLLTLPVINLTAQINKINSEETGGAYPVELNDASHPCISAEQYSIIESNCNTNARLLHIDNLIQNTSLATSLNWPLKAADGYNDCSFYFISAHVDQNVAAGTFQDYNCGTITYDGHRGTDIAISPFPFYKMDHNQVQVVAAAAGTILDKHDGEYDRNCVGVGSNLVANYVVLQHTDGSRTFYWHMKSGMVTTKAIGAQVSAGEVLGIVGSSGSSSGAHLHFEVWSGSTVSTLVDPFSGTCNLLNATTWWQSQKPYTEPAVVKASVHTTDIVIPNCPETEAPNESDTYSIPFQGPGLSPGYAKFYIFIRNETSGTTVNMSILNPNSSVFNSWTHTCSSTYKFSYWGFSKLLPTIPGAYTFQATYNGITCSQVFNIQLATSTNEIDKNPVNIRVYPSPSNSSVTIQFGRALNNGELSLINMFGQKIKSIKNIYSDEIKLERENLPGGVYFISLIQNDKIIATEKLLLSE